MMIIRLTTALTLAAFALASPVSLHAQDAGPLGQRVATGVLRGLYVATPIVHMVDGISTMRVIDLGGRELNPLLAPQVNNRGVFIATKTGIAAAEIYLARRIAKKHKVRAIVALAALHTGYALVAAHNFRVARGMQAQTSAGQ